MAAEPLSIRTEELLAHAGWLRALARSLVTDSATADDLVQDTWVAALRHPPEPDRPLRPWLARVVQNLARNRRRGDVRRRERETLERSPSESISPEKIAAEVEAQRVLADAVFALDEPLRTTIVLRYFRGMNATEIADAQSVPAGTVRWRLKRAIELLRAELDGRFGGRRDVWSAALGVLSAQRLAKVAIMSTSTKIGIAAALALCVGVAAWQLTGSSPSSELEVGELVKRSELLSQPAPLDSVVEESPREVAAVAETVPAVHTARLAALVADDCCIVGRVVDAQGEPLANVFLVAAPVEGEAPLGNLPRSQDVSRAQSSSEGAFRLPVDSAVPCAVVAEMKGLASQAVTPCFAGQTIEIVMTEGATVRVRVVSREWTARGPVDAIVPGARVSAWASMPGMSKDYWRVHGRTDDSGELELSQVPTSTIHLNAMAGFFLPAFMTIDSRGVGVVPCEIALAVPGMIKGTVIDRVSRLPIPNSSVESLGTSCDGTDAEGRYELAIAPGASMHSVEAWASGYAHGYAYVQLSESGMTKRLDFELEPAQRVRGRVVDSAGGPILRAKIDYTAQLSTEPFVGETQRGSTVTDASGVFEISDLRADTSYRLVATSEGFGARMLTFGPLAAGRATVELGDIALSPPGSVRGRIEGPELHDAVIRIHADGGPDDRLSRLGSTRPDPKGRFVFDGLGAGRYRLELVMRDATKGKSGERIVVAQSLDLRAGEIKTDVVLRVASSEIFGRVLDEEGGPIDGCRVSIFKDPRSTEPLVSAYNADDGTFSLLVDGTEAVRVVVDDPRLLYESKSIEDVRPGEELRVVLEPFRSSHVIRGRLLDPSGESPRNVYVAFTDTTTKERLARVALPDDNGRFEMKDLRDVAYDLELVDFGNLYKPVKVESVRPSGQDVVLQIERRP